MTMSIETRRAKINKIAEQARVAFDNRKHNDFIAYNVNSLRTDKPYQIGTFVHRNGVLQATVSLYSYDHKEQINEAGNVKSDFGRGIDYKALGALKRRAKDAGKVLSICLGKDSYQDALLVLRFGGELIKISNLGNGVLWGTLR